MLTVADTAFSIACVRAAESERPQSERLFEDPFAAVFCAAGAHAQEGTNRFLELPFFVDGIRLRTRAIDDFAREGIEAGIRQVVFLGAGFDTRALRLPEFRTRGARVFEIDFSKQLELKRSLLTTAGVSFPPWLSFVPCDFQHADFPSTLTADLVRCGFRPGDAALFLWEGVIAYIDNEAIDRTLRFVVSTGGPRTRLVFDFAPIAFDPDPAEARVRWAGFERFEQIGYDALWRRYLKGEPHANASVLCLGMAFV